MAWVGERGTRHGWNISAVASGSENFCVDAEELLEPDEHSAVTGSSHRPLRSFLKNIYKAQKSMNLFFLRDLKINLPKMPKW